MALESMGDGSFVGYNRENINALRDIINTTASKSAAGIVDRLHSEIVVPMSTVWYAPEAVTFFEGFAQIVASAGQNITDAFNEFRRAIHEAGEHWAYNTGGEAPALRAIDIVELNLNVTEIQSNNSGNIVIDQTRATNIANNLANVEAHIKADLEGLATNLNAETAFIGGGQAAAIQHCFVVVSGEVHKIFKFLTEGDNNIQSQINKAAEKYGQLSSDISSSFNSVNSTGI